MYNDFVLIGPKSDPAKVAGSKDILEAPRKMKERARRSSRAGIAAERIWPSWTCGRRAAIDIEKEKGPWYRETGQGMGPALNSASSMNAYFSPTAARGSLS